VQLQVQATVNRLIVHRSTHPDSETHDSVVVTAIQELLCFELHVTSDAEVVSGWLKDQACALRYQQ
jgi:hypothetical protein